MSSNEKILKPIEIHELEKPMDFSAFQLKIASPEKILIETEGVLEGLITEEEKGQNGFGYDPIFFAPALEKTVAQLTAKEKNAVSHRGNAIRKLKPQLNQLLKNA